MQFVHCCVHLFVVLKLVHVQNHHLLVLDVELLPLQALQDLFLQLDLLLTFLSHEVIPIHVYHQQQRLAFELVLFQQVVEHLPGSAPRLESLLRFFLLIGPLWKHPDYEDEHIKGNEVVEHRPKLQKLRY